MTGDLSQEEIALVLRRAAELDRDASCQPGTGLDAVALEQIALEAGITPQSVRRALAELRAGVLDQPPAPRRAWLGPPTLTVCRTLPGPAALVEQQLHRFLARELFELRRDLGERTVWVARRGLDARVRRTIDRGVQRRLILREVQHVELSVIAEPGGEDERVLVRMEIDVRAMRRTQGKVSAAAAATGGGLAAIGAGLAGLDPVLLVTTAAGGGIAAAGYRVGSAFYRSRVEDIESGVAGLLDRLERPASWRPR
ncbi:MAG: hypothetical protein M3314_08460 [Actinomycetota bacterium]|nr:hypothetical protein [Actinomycetota bacterium]